MKESKERISLAASCWSYGTISVLSCLRWRTDRPISPSKHFGSCIAIADCCQRSIEGTIHAGLRKPFRAKPSWDTQTTKTVHVMKKDDQK
jgi:hypothetical protein